MITFGLRFEAPPGIARHVVEVVLSARSANDSSAVDREGFRVDVSTPGWPLPAVAPFAPSVGHHVLVATDVDDDSVQGCTPVRLRWMTAIRCALGVALAGLVVPAAGA